MYFQQQVLTPSNIMFKICAAKRTGKSSTHFTALTIIRMYELVRCATASKVGRDTYVNKVVLMISGVGRGRSIK